MTDKFTLGFIAGLIGAIPMNAINLFNYYGLRSAELRYLDFAGFMVFGKLPQTTAEIIMSQMVQVLFSGILGAFFAKFLEWVSPKNSWFKGLLWGNGTWFVIYSITVLFRIPKLSTPNLNDALMQNISTAIYGIVMALVFGRLIKRAETKTEPNPELRKYRILPMPSYKKENQIKKVHHRKPFKIK